MGCSSGCGTNNNGIPAGCNNNGACGTESGCNKLSVFNWLANMTLPESQKPFDVVEVRFKNSRKEFYKNANNLSLYTGDTVAVEAGNGHDIGMISLTGELVKLQLKKRNVNFDSEEIKKIYRKAKQTDIDKWKEAQALEVDTMYRARTIALKLGLEMKLSDVEFQGDKSKAIFYYTAEARVDFRELIKVLADEFKVRIEMKQIGARQEAARLGGIGSCGRELCCSTWLTDFRTVATSAARYQQLSLNPLKLAGQCGKLKCCINYELDSYVDALKMFPSMEGKKLVTKKGDAFLQKTDIFKKIMWFSYRHEPGIVIPLSIETVNDILEKNSKSEIPEELKAIVIVGPKIAEQEESFENNSGQESLTRFDRSANKNQRPKKKVQHHEKRNPLATGTKPTGTKPTAQANTSTEKKQNPNQRPKMNRTPDNQRNKGQTNPNQKPKNNPNENKKDN